MLENLEKKNESNPLIKNQVTRRGEKVKAETFQDLSSQDIQMENFIKNLNKKTKKDPTLTKKKEKNNLSVTSFLKKFEFKKFILGFYGHKGKTPEEIEIINFGKKVF